MTNLVFPYDSWNPSKDLRPYGAATGRAFATVDAALDIGDVPANKNPKHDKTVGPTIDEVCVLLMECVEWLRERGLSAAEVQSKFNRHKKEQSEKLSRRTELTSWREIHLPSDTKKLYARQDEKEVAKNNKVFN